MTERFSQETPTNDFSLLQTDHIEPGLDSGCPKDTSPQPKAASLVLSTPQKTHSKFPHSIALQWRHRLLDHTE
jgi:hypothetical protein